LFKFFESSGKQLPLCLESSLTNSLGKALPLIHHMQGFVKMGKSNVKPIFVADYSKKYTQVILKHDLDNC